MAAAMTQRDYMRQLYRENRGSEAAIVDAYAKAERAGLVERKSNSSGLGALDYARALLNDGIRKGWIREPDTAYGRGG